MKQGDKHIKVIISGGGTGGHIYPALAIADALKAQYGDNADILFVGAQGKMEMEKVPERGYPIVGLWISGLQRKLTAQNLLFPVKLVASLFKAFGLLTRFSPDVVVGVGGYASGAVLRVAQWMGLPTIIQEQNSYAGVTNKLLAQQAKHICVAYPNMGRYFPEKKMVFTGNPVRKDIEQVDALREEALAHFGLSTDKKTLLILGGSLGARTINESVFAALPLFEEQGLQVIWQTGKFYHEEFVERTKTLQRDGLKLMPFIKRMDFAYATADIVVSRAGALSVSELCIAEKAAILVPSPNVAEDHQTKNALSLTENHAAIMVKDADAVASIGQTVIDTLNDKEKLESLSQEIKKLAKPEAAADIAKLISVMASA